MRHRAAFLLLAPLLVALLAGCGDDGSTTTRDDKNGKEKPAAQGLPRVVGDYGEKPTVTSDPDVKPGTKTRAAVLVKGDGPKVAQGDLLVADYLGQIYATNKMFDNSYDRGQPSGFQIGTGKVIVGWDKTLVGVNAGSRVVMVVPPAEGYGEQGNTNAGIKGTDSLVFVVDVIASYGKGGPRAASIPATKLPQGLPDVSGEPGERPTVTVPKGTQPPKEPKATILATGTGPRLVRSKLTVLHFEAVTWAGQKAASSWEAGAPQAVPLGSPDQKSPFDILVGTPIGSRVLVVLPPQQGGAAAKDSVVAVVDVIAQHGPAKEGAT